MVFRAVGLENRHEALCGKRMGLKNELINHAVRQSIRRVNQAQWPAWRELEIGRSRENVAPCFPVGQTCSDAVRHSYHEG
jgi:hypothetical protein